MWEFKNQIVYYGSRKKTFFSILLLGLTICLYKFYNVNSTTNFSKLSVVSEDMRVTVVDTSALLMLHNSSFRESGTRNMNKTTLSLISTNIYKQKDLKHFDINGTDVMVFLHIQKTGGSAFGRNLIRNLYVRSCKKKKFRKKVFECLRPNDNSEWLFSRFTTGWQCGLHADWTSLTECVPEQFEPLENGTRVYFYITLLRDPVARYLSEWGHVSLRSATWNASYLRCNGRVHQFPRCWTGPDWSGVSLKEFMECPDNQAINRQTWMLANLRKIDCTGVGIDLVERDRIMLESAKKNLEDMMFFGLTERQQQSQLLFETTFGLHFKIDFLDRNDTHTSSYNYTQHDIERIKQLNYLDVELYNFALNLFDERFNTVKRDTTT